MFDGCVVIHSETISKNGCFAVTRYWIKGHRDFKGPNVTCVYIFGKQGPETEVTVYGVTARQVVGATFTLRKAA